MTNRAGSERIPPSRSIVTIMSNLPKSFMSGTIRRGYDISGAGGRRDPRRFGFRSLVEEAAQASLAGAHAGSAVSIVTLLTRTSSKVQ